MKFSFWNLQAFQTWYNHSRINMLLKKKKLMLFQTVKKHLQQRSQQKRKTDKKCAGEKARNIGLS